MANTRSQADAIRDLLVERLTLFDSSLDTSKGSALWTQVVQPVFDALGTDPFDTDIRAFLKARMTQAFPLVSAQDGDAVVDLLITPLEVLLEPLKRETQIVRRGQSARHPETMRLEDARDLAANFFVQWDGGSRATGTVRVYYAAPTYVTILPTVEFSTSAGLKFHPTTPFTVRPEQMALFRSGTEYYIEVPVASAETGDGYNVTKGTVTTVRGISGYTRITNIADFQGGLPAQTTQQLLAQVRSSLSERTLNVRRGIVARIRQDFAGVSDVEVVGYGDPEMNRDVITGRGEGSVVASGVCFVVGQFVLMFSMFEDRGNAGTTAVTVGDEVELNFWKFLYDVDSGSANEKFTIDTILFDSRESMADMPSVLLFRMSSAPSVSMPVAGTLAGVLPGVFAVVRHTGVIEISDIPGGILNPDTARGTVEINDGEIHVGGHYDVWLRTPAHTDDSATFSDTRSEAALLEGTDLVTSGEGSNARHLVTRTYTVTSTTSFALGAVLTCAASGAAGTVAYITASGTSRIYTLWETNGILLVAGDTVTDGTTEGTLSGVSAQLWADSGVLPGMVLSLPSGNEEGAYRILAVDGPFLYVDIDLTTTTRGQFFRVLSEVTIDLFDPKAVLVPFGEALGDDLRTTIGSSLLRTTVNLQDYGAAVGDTVEILSGDDVGTYTIASWSTTYGGTGPTLSSAMTATNSQVEYRVYRTTQALQRPFLRVKPGGVVLLDTSGQDSGYTVPYALPVDTRAVGAFSGSKSVATGLNGFVLLDPGDGWAPTAAYTTDIAGFDWKTWTGGTATQGEAFADFYDAEKFKRCYTDACVAGDGYIAVVSVYGSGQMFLDSALPSSAQTFLQSAQAWILSVISTFNFGGDEEELVNALSPIRFGPNSDTSVPLLLQFEILIPFEVFDGCTNVFVALPEFDWTNTFEEEASFGDALAKFNNGTLTGADPALLQASPGDVLTVLSGQNAGAYVVDSVHAYYLINAGALVDGGDSVNLDNAYKVALVVVRSVFPVDALAGLPDFFAGGTATWALPSVPTLPYTVTDSSGGAVDGWDFVQLALTWFFQTLTSLGFDIPSGITLDVPSTLKALWQLLFNSYSIGRPTAPQYLRLYFQEPTSVTVFAPQVCSRYQWAPPLHVQVTATGANFTLPFAEFDGLAVDLKVETLTGSKSLSGTMDASCAAATTIAELAALLQALLDPDGEWVTFSGPGDVTGALTITTVSGGLDTFLYVTAADVTDGFRWMGFIDEVGQRWPEITSTGAFTALTLRITWPPPAAGLLLTLTLGDDSTESIDVQMSAINGNLTQGEVADLLQQAVAEALTSAVPTPILDATVTVTFALVADVYVYALSITSANIKAYTIDSPTNGDYDAFHWLFALAPLSASGAVSTELVVTGEDISTLQGAAVVLPFDATLVAGATTTTFSAQTCTYDEARALEDLMLAGDLSALAAALNATPAAYAVDDTRWLWYVGGSTLSVRSVPGSTATVLTLTATSSEAYWALGFTDPASLAGTDVVSAGVYEGATTPGTAQTLYAVPPDPTIFTAVAGAAELLFTPSLEAPPFPVFPGQTSDGSVAVTALPRDAVVATVYEGQLSAEVVLTDTSYASALVLGITVETDWLWIYEQRTLLEFTSYSATDTDTATDRVVAVFTVFGSNTITLPDFSASGSNEFTFLAPHSGREDDQVQVGDIVLIEEGDDTGGYTVVARSATTLVLDRALTSSTERVYRFGNDGAIASGSADFTAATGAFTTADIGRYLTLWAMNRDSEDGSYKITAVASDGTSCTLDTDTFTYSETSAHWVVVAAPTDTIPESEILGRTALVGLRPIRVYSGTPSEHRVVAVAPSLDRVGGLVTVALDVDGSPPKGGVQQPYQFVRPGVQHLSASAMKANLERGLFTFDVLAQSLGADDIYNIPSQAKLEPVFGTYASDGYRVDVADSRYTFSAQEDATLVLTPTFLPVGLDDLPSNRVVLDARSLRVDYEHVPVVVQVQGLLSSENDRVLCANALARHFLPAYVYFDLMYAGRNVAATVATAVNSYIAGLSAVDTLDVSRLEKILHQNSVTRYDHPVVITTLTHDLDRRIVGTRSENVISDDEIAYNGTNRTTFFVAGPDQSAVEADADVPVGERTRLVRSTIKATFR